MSITLEGLEEVFNSYKGIFGELVEVAEENKVELEITCDKDGGVKLQAREHVDNGEAVLCKVHKIYQSRTQYTTESSSYLWDKKG